jgi:hypothetical protein
MKTILKTAVGIAAAIAMTAGLLGVMGLELQRSFDPTPMERAAVQAPRGIVATEAGARPDAGAAEPACC